MLIFSGSLQCPASWLPAMHGLALLAFTGAGLLAGASATPMDRSD